MQNLLFPTSQYGHPVVYPALLLSVSGLYRKKHIWIAWLLGCSLYILICLNQFPVNRHYFLGVLLHALSTGKLTKKDFWNLIIHPGLAFLAMHIIFSVFLSFNLFQSFCTL